MGEFAKTTIKFMVCALIFGFTLVHSEKCPLPEDIHPCSCRTDSSLMTINCEGLQSHMHLKTVMARLEGQQIDRLQLHNSNLGDVPGNIFQGTHIEYIYIYNTNMTSFGDEINPAFKGLENSLNRLEIFMEKLLKKPLRLSHLDQLKDLALMRMEIKIVGNDWFNDGPMSLQHLWISHCGVEQVGLKAFSRLENLVSLSFVGNNVVLPRSALPAKALYLKQIDMQNNVIREIPKDFFEDLPALTDINLDSTSLTSIPQATWESIWPQLSSIHMPRNALVCDSELKWIFNHKKINYFSATCDQPDRLNGRHISSLRQEEL